MEKNLWQEEQYLSEWLNRFAEMFRYPTSCVIAAIVSPLNEMVTAYDRIDETIPHKPDMHTLFEIGSITKVFTTILLTKFVVQGKIDPDKPIGNLIEELRGIPDWITPRNLASHASGLPTFPVEIMEGPEVDPDNPGKHITGKELFEWMHKYCPQEAPEPGSFLYSNTGMGLLGELIARAAGADYYAALREEILKPLNLADTVIDADEDQRSRLVIPHNVNGPTNFLELQALAPAGTLCSTMSDLISFARSVISAPGKDDIVSAAIMKSLEVQQAAKDGIADRCMGWFRLSQQGNLPSIYFHNGGTGGSASELFICPEANLATILLANHNRADGRECDPIPMVYELIGKASGD